MNTKKSLPNIIISSLVLVWLTFCCLTFFILHSPLWYWVLQYFPSAISKLFASGFRLPDNFWLDIACSVILLAINGVVGMFFLRLFIRLPLVLEITANIFVGIGISNFLLMFLAILFWLNPVSILVSYAVMIGLLVIAKMMWGWVDQEFQTEVINPKSTMHDVLFYSAFSVAAVITLLSFYHAVLFPVNYWDSLIYYVHYGKLTYEQGGFPILYCLQVGLGLGANYPHLFPLYQAVNATLFNHWSDLYGQFLCPLAGLGTCVVIYYLCLHLFNNRLNAMLAVLVFRTVPYVNSYITWASDYALIMVYTSLLLLFLRWFLLHPNRRMLQPLLCIAAVFPHINYLGWIVWSVVGLAILWNWKRLLSNPKQIASVLLVCLLWIVIASTWYARNYAVTGNPVYAFFPEILGGENINLEVLRSSEQEWKYHGLGAAHIPGDTVFYRLLNTPVVLLELFQFSSVVLGIMLPALFLGWKRNNPFFVIAAVLVGLYGCYEYFISGFYWYHIIAVFPMLAVFTARFLSQIQSGLVYNSVAVCLIVAGIAPGITFSIAGTKHTSPMLEHFHLTGLEPIQFYRVTSDKKYASSWAYLNDNAEPDVSILSHENRYHVFRDDLNVIHLDDCDLTPYYDQPYEVVHEVMWDKGVRYYLFIVDEWSHPITQRLGHQQYLNDERYFEFLHQTVNGNSEDSEVTAMVYRLVPPQD